jgi:hypothetical protein
VGRSVFRRYEHATNAFNSDGGSEVMGVGMKRCFEGKTEEGQLHK